MKYYVYILKSLIDGTFYIGQTNDLRNRLKRHNQGYIKSTKHKKPFDLCYFEEYNTRAKAMLREFEIKKKFNKNRREKLVETFDSTKLKEILGL